MKNYNPTERDRDTQACRDLWADVLNNAMDLAGKCDKQSRRFIQDRTGTFDWICNQLDLNAMKTSQAIMAAVADSANNPGKGKKCPQLKPQ